MTDLRKEILDIAETLYHIDKHTDQIYVRYANQSVRLCDLPTPIALAYVCDILREKIRRIIKDEDH